MFDDVGTGGNIGIVHVPYRFGIQLIGQGAVGQFDTADEKLGTESPVVKDRGRILQAFEEGWHDCWIRGAGFCEYRERYVETA